MNTNVNIVSAKKHSHVKLRWDKSNLQHYYEASQLGLQPILDEFGPMYNELIDDFARSHANNYCFDEPSVYKNKRLVATELIKRFKRG